MPRRVTRTSARSRCRHRWRAVWCSTTICSTARPGIAGQVGHIIVEPGGRRCVCGAQGCLDAEASGVAIESITGRPLTEPTYEIMQRTGVLVGRAAATVCNTLDLTLVVVGGTIARNFAATFFHSAQVGARGTRPAAVQPRRAHHAVAPRRQRPADRCRRDGLAAASAAPSARPDRRAECDSGRLSRRRRGRSVRRDRCRSGAARRRRPRSRPPRRPSATGEGHVESGRFDPAEPVDDEVEDEHVGEIQRQGHLPGAAEGIGRAGEAFGDPVDAGVGDECGAERARHVDRPPSLDGRSTARPVGTASCRTTRPCVARGEEREARADRRRSPPIDRQSTGRGRCRHTGTRTTAATDGCR